MYIYVLPIQLFFFQIKKKSTDRRINFQIKLLINFVYELMDGRISKRFIDEMKMHQQRLFGQTMRFNYVSNYYDYTLPIL